jgi:hypothetical protein
MSVGAVWDIGMLLGGISGSGLTTWIVVSYKLGRREGTQAASIATLLKDRKEDRAEIDRLKSEAIQAEKRWANRFLRMFQAMEEIRRRIGNGDRTWIDLGGQ